MEKHTNPIEFDTNPHEKAIDPSEYAKRIAQLNDRFRQTYWGGKVMTTCGVNELPEELQARLFRAVAEFDDFDWRNDPHGEHDFGKVEIDNHEFFWKIDYYDARMEYGSEDPANPDVTTRVLTMMLTSEY
jgi:hypothetical protein